ncbi:MAG: glycerol-1-phosphate dehydrogenase [NAD(P)+] [Candidatus Nitrosomirales archaeon]|jgi:glycerol-1-phosphate dehydrogenase [NAD(P)+]
MELPRKILIGDGVIQELGNFVSDLGNVKNVAIVSGASVKARAGEQCSKALHSCDLMDKWFLTKVADMDSVNSVQSGISKDGVDIIIGFGGGKSVDIAKTVAYNLNKPFVSVPTSASHDGISSPFSSIRGQNKPYSIKTRTPIGVLADTSIIAKAPRRLLASGCGDLMAKVTAIKDWELARDENGEYFGNYSANLASMSAKIIMQESKSIGSGNNSSVRTVVEALISSGVASCIAGSSRPCSGAEHLFSHALDFIAPNKGLHGEKCGMGAIMIARLHDIEWEQIVRTLKDVGAPTTANEIGVDANTVVKALLTAATLRPERYTILNKVSLNEQKAFELAKSTGII